jgi:hypothetical protein
MNEASVVAEEAALPVPPPAEVVAADSLGDRVAAENSDMPLRPKAKGFEDVDSLLKALGEQDEQLKAMKQQITDVLATNALVRKSIKQIVQDASKNDEILAELASTKKKLHVIKQFLG